MRLTKNLSHLKEAQRLEDAQVEVVKAVLERGHTIKRVNAHGGLSEAFGYLGYRAAGKA